LAAVVAAGLAEAVQCRVRVEAARGCCCRFAGHIPGLRDTIGLTFGCATTQLLQPGGSASTPAWTGPSAVMPKWSTPSSNTHERPAWLGAEFDFYNRPDSPPNKYCNASAVDVRGQGQTQGRSQGRLCEYHSKLQAFLFLIRLPDISRLCVCHVAIKFTYLIRDRHNCPTHNCRSQCRVRSAAVARLSCTADSSS